MRKSIILLLLALVLVNTYAKDITKKQFLKEYKERDYFAGTYIILLPIKVLGFDGYFKTDPTWGYNIGGNTKYIELLIGMDLEWNTEESISVKYFTFTDKKDYYKEDFFIIPNRIDPAEFKEKVFSTSFLAENKALRFEWQNLESDEKVQLRTKNDIRINSIIDIQKIIKNSINPEMTSSQINMAIEKNKESYYFIKLPLVVKDIINGEIIPNKEIISGYKCIIKIGEEYEKRLKKGQNITIYGTVDLSMYDKKILQIVCTSIKE